MQIIFKKYQFPSQDFFRELLSKTEINPYTAITELGVLVENTYSVDTLWVNQLPEEWKEYEINDVQGNGAHTYMGWEFKPE